MSKSEPIHFSCPSCEAEYKIITIEVCDVQQGKLRCLKCDALLPAGEGRVAFKYFLVGRPKRMARAIFLSWQQQRGLPALRPALKGFPSMLV